LSGRNTDAVAFEAGRIMLKRLRQLSEAKADFAFESTLSSRTFATFLRALKRQGYVVAIYYFSLVNAQLAIRRVKLRVALGGHDVLPDVIRRRFGRSLNNFFHLYLPLADEWALFDNSSSVQAIPVATQFATQLTITETATWHKLKKLSQVV
jgi:predicted ABC-type ATPase